MKDRGEEKRVGRKSGTQLTREGENKEERERERMTNRGSDKACKWRIVAGRMGDVVG